jgi:D-glycero-D-manno-heptose 1,7-bisphosphate phosphatase
MSVPFVLLDRDGTLIEDVPYLNNWRQVRFLPGVISGLSELRARGFHLGIVSNQSGVGRGLISFKQLLQVNSHMVEVLLSNNVELDFLLCCIHSPMDACNCRKPLTGMMCNHPIKHKVLRSQSFMVGNSQCDIDFAINLGVNPILIAPGCKTEIYNSTRVASSFQMAIEIISQLK